MAAWCESQDLEIIVRAEPEPSLPFEERFFVGKPLSRGVTSRSGKKKLRSFGQLPVKLYQFRLTDESSTGSTILGSLTDVNGPDHEVSFAQLWTDLVHPTNRAELAKIYTQILDGRSIQWRVRFRWQTLKTKVLHVGSFNAESGVVQGVLLDMTEGKEDHGHHIENEKMTAMGLMAVGVAHDLNNLLCAILSFTQFAQAEMAEESQEWSDLSEVIKAAERAESLTKQLLTFSRARETAAKKVDLNQRLSELSAIVARLLGGTIRLNVATSPHPAMVSIDPVQFDQVVINLALNARDAMLPEGGCLSISLDPGGPNVQAVLLKIEDSGRGMDSATMERIFEPFFTTKPDGAGTGFGLTTCYNIVEKTGGRIEVESSLGKGTVFTVSWPLAEDG